MEIQAGQLVAFYLFDVCETVDLSNVQYENPPLSFDTERLGSGDIEGFRARISSRRVGFSDPSD